MYVSEWIQNSVNRKSWKSNDNNKKLSHETNIDIMEKELQNASDKQKRPNALNASVESLNGALCSENDGATKRPMGPQSQRRTPPTKKLRQQATGKKPNKTDDKLTQFCFFLYSIIWSQPW